MKFLETITFFGNDVLVPIDKIQYISMRMNNNNSWEIVIKGEGEYEWVEHFGTNSAKAQERYEMIKDIVEAK